MGEVAIYGQISKRGRMAGNNRVRTNCSLIVLQVVLYLCHAETGTFRVPVTKYFAVMW